MKKKIRKICFELVPKRIKKFIFVFAKKSEKKRKMKKQKSTLVLDYYRVVPEHPPEMDFSF